MWDDDDDDDDADRKSSPQPFRPIRDTSPPLPPPAPNNAPLDTNPSVNTEEEQASSVNTTCSASVRDVVTLKSRLHMQLKERLFNETSEPLAAVNECTTRDDDHDDKTNIENESSRGVDADDNGSGSEQSPSSKQQRHHRHHKLKKKAKKKKKHKHNKEKEKDTEQQSPKHKHRDDKANKKKTATKNKESTNGKKTKSKHELKNGDACAAAAAAASSESFQSNDERANCGDPVRRSDRIKTIEVQRQHTKVLRIAEKLNKFGGAAHHHQTHGDGDHESTTNVVGAGGELLSSDGDSQPPLPPLPSTPTTTTTTTSVCAVAAVGQHVARIEDLIPPTATFEYLDENFYVRKKYNHIYLAYMT